MKHFDLQGIEVRAEFRSVHAFIADPGNLPKWAHAFEKVRDGAAELVTPNGKVPIKLTVKSSIVEGTIDWFMDFPDGSQGKAFSRVVELEPKRCLYAFTLLAPPVPLEMLEGALAQQAKTLSEELSTLKTILEAQSVR